MDFSWLTGIFGKLFSVLSPLKAIAHWKIWLELKHWYERFKKWRDWYKLHILTPMRQAQQLQRQIYNQFMRPVLTLVDHIRRLASIVGLFNKKLADKLNLYFLRVESYLLAPFNKMTGRVNLLGRTFGSILTPLGYFDRGTLLNSVWRDAALIKETLSNPFGQHPGTATLEPGPTVTDRIGNTRSALKSDSGPYAQPADDMMVHYKETLAGV